MILWIIYSKACPNHTKWCIIMLGNAERWSRDFWDGFHSSITRILIFIMNKTTIPTPLSPPKSQISEKLTACCSRDHLFPSLDSHANSCCENRALKMFSSQNHLDFPMDMRFQNALRLVLPSVLFIFYHYDTIILKHPKPLKYNVPGWF